MKSSVVGVSECEFLFLFVILSPLQAPFTVIHFLNRLSEMRTYNKNLSFQSFFLLIILLYASVCIKFKVPTLTTNRRKRRKPICFKYQFYLSSQSKEKVYFIFRIFLFRSFTLIVSFCFEWTFNLQFNFSFLTSIFRYFISHNQKKKKRRSVMF